jgi:hypothetical protein
MYNNDGCKQHETIRTKSNVVGLLGSTEARGGIQVVYTPHYRDVLAALRSASHVGDLNRQVEIDFTMRGKLLFNIHAEGHVLDSQRIRSALVFPVSHF